MASLRASPLSVSVIAAVCIGLAGLLVVHAPAVSIAAGGYLLAVAIGRGIVEIRARRPSPEHLNRVRDQLDRVIETHVRS